MRKKLSSNPEGLVYSGVWESDGHSISFMIYEDDTVQMIEVYQPWQKGRNRRKKTFSQERILPLDKAIEIQERFIKLGYDKVS